MHIAAIGSMPLYSTIERVRNELRELGAPQTLTASQLYPFDQIHYRGTDAVRDAAVALHLRPGDRVLDVGSGIGGPARCLASTIGCQVTALELQEPMHALGRELTARCGLSELVTHLCGDALVHPLADDAYDAAVSWLMIHHVPGRPRLLRRIATALRAGGRLYIEDLCTRAPFAPEDQADVEQTLFGATMTSADEYVDDVRAAGFAMVEATDMRDEWTAFCAARADAWRANAARHRRVHGEAIVATLDRFFTTVQRLFENGSLGGLRIVAQKS